jgi:L-2-hydroxyglutarate oxidase LhgO
MDFIDTCIIGGGVVGLAIGRSLAASTPSLLVLDQADLVGQGISSRNSEVIHGGLYYPQGSLKARLCVAGKRQLYAYCQARGIAHQRIGKLVVATRLEEEDALARISALAEANGVDDLAFWSAAKIEHAEPAVKATLALYSPSTGIVSAHDLMRSLLADIQALGGDFVGRARVTAVAQTSTGFELTCHINGEAYHLGCRQLVNAAGLGAQMLAERCAFVPSSCVPRLYLCKGDYFSLLGPSPFQHLIYPVPEACGAGLGVHATLDLGGQVKFGPDVEYIQAEDYGISSTKHAQYCAAIQRYYPGLQASNLVPGYAGIRPKLQGPGESPHDFQIQGQASHGVPGLVQLFGIESPGLTCALAIGDHVTDLLANTAI